MGGRAEDMRLTIDDLNRMAVSEFAARFGDVAEHSPWVAERAAGARPFADRDAVVQRLCPCPARRDEGRESGRAARASGSRRPGGGQR